MSVKPMIRVVPTLAGLYMPQVRFLKRPGKLKKKWRTIFIPCGYRNTAYRLGYCCALRNVREVYDEQ